MIKSSLTPPAVTQADIDFYVAKGNRERSKAVLEIVGVVRRLFGQRKPVITPLTTTKLKAA